LARLKVTRIRETVLTAETLRSIEQSLCFELVWGIKEHASAHQTWPWRRENVLRVWQVVAGKIQIELMDGRVFQREPGDGYVIPPLTKFRHTGTPHVLRGAKMRFTVLGTIDACSLFEMPATLTRSQVVPFIELTDQMCDLSLQIEGHALDVAHMMKRQALGFTLFERLASLSRVLPGAQERLLRAGRLVPAIQFMKDNLGRSITRRELAKSVCLSEGRFGELFQAAFGQSCMSYLTRLRMTRAQELLIQGTHGISEIAAILGFTDVAHFSNVFKARCSVSPSAYRHSGSFHA
jgi:AraC-like DNA-binding protein